MISESYRREQTMLHLNPEYGCASVTYAPLVAQIVNKLQVTELLDFGCGKAKLMGALKGRVGHELLIQCFDPAIPGFAEVPSPMQFVACIDVCEHFEPEFLEANLDELARLTKIVGFFTICCVPAEKELSDGRNAHLTIKPPEWWWRRIAKRFEIQTFQRVENGCYFIVYRKLQPLVETSPGIEIVRH